jgi:hypothetical protein
MTIKPKWDSKSAGEYERRMKAEKEDDDDIQVYKKPWVGLTDEERDDCYDEVEWNTIDWCPDHKQLMMAVEKKLKEKNT